MNEVEIHVIEAQPVHRGVKSLERRVIPLIGVVELGGHKQFLARDRGGANCGAKALFVAVRRSTIEVAVADLECLLHVALDVIRGDLPQPQPDVRDCCSVGQGGCCSHSASMPFVGG